MSIVESLKKLVDPVAARDTAAELRSAREQPRREGQGAPPTYECRVCGHLGPDSNFCPICLAATMRPSRKALPVPPSAKADVSGSPAADASGSPDANHGGPAEVPPVEIPLDGTLDLHTFKPAEVRELLPAYIQACADRDIRDLRIVHGKGTGALRRTVEALLSRSPLVQSFRPGDETGGGWGATLVKLHGQSAGPPPSPE